MSIQSHIPAGALATDEHGRLWIHGGLMYTCVLALAGCPADDNMAGEGATTGTDGTSETGDVSEGDPSESGADGDASTGDESSGGQSAQLAAGIEIRLVEANQGVGVALTDGTTWRSPEQRNARLMRDRPMLIRVEYDVEDGWEPREIEAVLEVRVGEEVTEWRASRMVEAAADPTDLETQFSFRLGPDEVVPGSDFQIRLEEADGTVGVDDDAAAVAPAQPELIGVEDVTAMLDVVLVPVEVEGCETNLGLDVDSIEPVLSRLIELHPTQGLALQIREESVVAPEAFDACGGGALVGELMAARKADGAPDDQLYIGLFEEGCATGSCTCSTFGPDSATMQAAASGTDPQVAADNVRHCTGLLLGGRHVNCTGGEAGADPEYPYEGGDIGSTGYSIETGELYPPTTKSYLSFCEDPTWVSDYHWNKAWDALSQ